MPRPSVFSSRPISPVEETVAGDREARQRRSTTSKGAEPSSNFKVSPLRKRLARAHAHTLKLNKVAQAHLVNTYSHTRQCKGHFWYDSRERGSRLGWGGRDKRRSATTPPDWWTLPTKAATGRSGFDFLQICKSSAIGVLEQEVASLRE